MNQSPDMALTLLIDGNNLAHFLYTKLAPGQKMTSADSLRLISHLDSYARQYHEALQIELCMDRWPGEMGILQDNLRVFGASFPQNADDLLIDRFWYHHIGHRPCLVITNDDAILKEVTQASGTILRVFDFVRRPGLVSPVFRSPDNLPQVIPPVQDDDESEHKLSLNTSVYFRFVENPRYQKEWNIRKTNQQTDANRISPVSRTVKPIAQSDPTHSGSQPELKSVTGTAQESYSTDADKSMYQRSEAISNDEPSYYLALENWPLEEGIHFLNQVFCDSHRAEYQDLLELLDPAHLDRDDLRALAELLLQACGGDENFARRGSLMNRVRLALLKARGEPVSLGELASATGLKKNGLQGRIKGKAGRWVGIISGVGSEQNP